MTGFFPPVSYPANSYPLRFALSDFNGDGFLDIAAPNADYSSRISVLLGAAGGTFLAPVTYTANTPSAVVAGDFNGDGVTDLAVSSYGDTTVSVLLGVGDGTFLPQITTNLGVSGSYGLAAGDINEDGVLDLAVGSVNGSGLSVLLGDGTGAFQTPNSIAAPSRTWSVELADLNGDGHLDLVTADHDNSTVSVALGAGDGTFAPAVSYAAGSVTTGLAVADFDGDGDLDVAASNLYAHTISVLLGNGDGTLQPQVAYATGGFYPYQVAAADLNGDGIVDLSVPNFSSNTIGTLLGNGDGTFQPAEVHATGSSPYFVAGADLDGDGFVDLVNSDYGGSSVSVLLQGPSVEISTSDPALAPGQTATITFTFNEAPVGFDASDISATAGTVDPATFAMVDPTHYTIVFTPDFSGPTGTVSVADGAFTSGTGESGFGDSLALAEDNVAPTISIGTFPATFQITGLFGTNAVAIEVNSATGDDRGGIAVSTDQVFLTGDSATGRASRTDLSGATDSGFDYDGLVSNVASDAVFTLSTDGVNPAGYGGGTITHLLGIDPATGALSGSNITLSSPISVTSGAFGQAGIFAGYNEAVFFDGGSSEWWGVDLTTGAVTDLGLHSPPFHQGTESWAFWGTAEDFGGEIYVDYVQDNQTIERLRVSDGATSTLATFSNLSDMASFTVAPDLNRWYFHYEGTGEFRSGDETLGFADASFSATPAGSGPIAGDDIVSAAEAAGGVTISGMVEGVESGQTVTVSLVNNATSTTALTVTTATTGRIWTVTLTPAQAQALADGAYTVQANVTDLAGNPAPTATHALTIDETAVIAITAIAGDDRVDPGETAAGFSIQGTTSSVEDGQIVTVHILDSTSTIVDTITTTVSGGTWTASVSAAEAQALALGDYTATADVSDALGQAAPQASRSFLVDDDIQFIDHGDGSFSYVYYDRPDDYPWTYATYEFDTQGRLDYVVVDNDDGTRYVVDKDQGDAHPWTSVVGVYDDQGRLDYAVVNNEDGTRDVTDFDQTGGNSWTSVIRHFDDQGRLDYTAINNDDGTRFVIDHDQGDANPWSSIVGAYDSLGRLDYSVRINDDGTREVTDHDQADANPWSSITGVYDALGRLDYAVVDNDDGTRTVTDLDQASANPWSFILYSYDDQHHLIHTEVHYDDGSTVLV